MKTMPARHISTTINRSAAVVYEYLSDPSNLPNWASGLSSSALIKEGDAWIAESPMGRVMLKFADKNPYGVLDHDVTLKSGVTVHNPMRVLPNGDGSEVVFTLFRQPETSDAQFNDDAKWIEKDLKTLKDHLEK